MGAPHCMYIYIIQYILSSDSPPHTCANRCSVLCCCTAAWFCRCRRCCSCWASTMKSWNTMEMSWFWWEYHWSFKLGKHVGSCFFQSIIVASNKLTIYIHYVYIYTLCIYIYWPFRGGWIDYVESYVKNCEDIYYTIQFGGVIIFSNPHLYAYINCMCIYICIYIYVYIYVYIYICIYCICIYVYMYIYIQICLESR